MRNAAIAGALGVLAYQGLHYDVAAIEHFAFDFSAANYGRFWCERRSTP